VRREIGVILTALLLCGEGGYNLEGAIALFPSAIIQIAPSGKHPYGRNT